MPPKSTKEDPAADGRIPRPALAVAAIGLLLSIGVFGLSLTTGGSSAERDWDVVEPVRTPPARDLGADGSLKLARTSISALAPNEDGYLIFQIAGVVQVDSGDKSPTALRCDVSTTNGGESMIARTTSKRAAWPRPSEELQRQQVPERAVAKFHTDGSGVQQLPIRDVFRRYTDSAAPTLVDWDWDGEQPLSQTWLWTMPEGTGRGGATLGYAAIFRTQEQPAGEIDCRVKSAPKSGPDRAASVSIPVKLKTWPIPDRTEDTGQGSEATDIK